MKLNEILIASSILFVFSTICVIFFCSCCHLDGRKMQTDDNLKDATAFSTTDTLPGFEYAGLKREIQPAKQIINGKLQFNRDTLLSMYLEDNIHCPNYCEGIFQYTIQLDINKTGKIEKITFEKDEYNSEILQKLITEELKKIQFEPAIKNNINVSVNITINVLIDLYNYPSRMRKTLIRE